MRKLHLHLDLADLRVESFHALPSSPDSAGTVQGHGIPYDYDVTERTGCGQDSCAESCGGYTCGFTCEGSCVQTCAGSCGGTCQASACYDCGQSYGGSCFWQDCMPDGA